MNREVQRRLVRQAFAALDDGAPPLGETFTENDPAAYTSPARATFERDVLFRRHPIVAGFSSELRESGDHAVDDLSLVPLLLVRDDAGALRAFANVCRHRGSKLVARSGRGARVFTCPYHAWSYELDGRVRAIPDDYGFSGLERRDFGLIELPAAERHGIVWVSPSPGAPLDLDRRLAGIGEELESYRIDGYRIVARRELRPRVNWKIASDTFWEAYHIKVLHRQNVAPLFVNNLALFEPFGRNHRYVGIRRSIEDLRGVPESEWELLPHATILMSLFPNTILVMQSDHLECFRLFPDAEQANACRVQVTVLAPVESAEDARWQRITDLLMGVVEQDFAIGETIQRSFDAGVLERVVYGRYENALEHFHRSVREALGA